jgi:DNA topoisomerase III
VNENFWKLEIKTKGTKFLWSRGHLFDKSICEALYERIEDSGVAVIFSVEKKPKLKYRPNPLNTVEATKLISRKLRISPEQAMSIMEKLYNKGVLSYPRTETTRFNPTINLRKIVSSLE